MKERSTEGESNRSYDKVSHIRTHLRTYIRTRISTHIRTRIQLSSRSYDKVSLFRFSHKEVRYKESRIKVHTRLPTDWTKFETEVPRQLN